jgi:threonine/homoserine/homoserine lactone efflux protein
MGRGSTGSSLYVPGPNVMFVVSRSLMLGRLAGVGTAAGGQIGASLAVTGRKD